MLNREEKYPRFFVFPFSSNLMIFPTKAWKCIKARGMCGTCLSFCLCHCAVAPMRRRGSEVWMSGWGGGVGGGFDISLKERDFPCFPFVYKTCPIWVVEPIRQQFGQDFQKTA